MDQFASHVVRALFLPLCPQLFRSDAPHKSQAFVRSRKSAAWKAKQGPLKSIFGDGPDKGKATCGGQTSPGVSEGCEEVCDNAEDEPGWERGSLAGCEQGSMPCCRYDAALSFETCSPVIPQMVLEIEANQGFSDEPGSLMDHVLVGLISAYRAPYFSRIGGFQP
jgi:nucleolar protein 9